ncbi:MAG: type II toxin-antitoxin system VapC family toxin [Rhodothermia bacterium]
MLAWLVDEPRSRTIIDVLVTEKTIVVSELTLVECKRVLSRSVATNKLNQTEAERMLAALGTTSAHWMRSSISQEVLEVASRPFPVEPIRTLDAIHLATAIRTRRALPDLKILSLDHWIRANGEALGFEILPGRLTPDG